MQPFGDLFWDTWNVLRDASFYVLFGFAAAALLFSYIPPLFVYRYLGTGRLRSILMSSLLGAPLPLCSCSVLPTAAALRKLGARRGATIAFLISTPETGVDSAFITYGLMDITMTIFRPVAAIITATIAGVITEFFGGEGAEAEKPAEVNAGNPRDLSMESHWRIFGRSFDTVFDDLGFWILIGLVGSGLISWFLPVELFEKYLSSGFMPMLLMLLIGLPLYVCASGSTPIAAALMLKGLSPGAALVFLLAGPATNIGTMAVVARMFGKRTLVLYVGTIAVVSLLLGVALDGIYAGSFRSPVDSIRHGTSLIPNSLQLVAAALFVLLLVRSVLRSKPPLAASTRSGRWILEKTGFRFTQRRAVSIAAGLLALSYFSSSILVVHPGEVGLVRRFGRLVGGVRQPGIHVDLPKPFTVMATSAADEVKAVDLGFRARLRTDEQGYTEVSRLDRLLDESIYFTGDENLLDINSVLFYRIRDAKRYTFGVRDPESIIRQAAFSAFVKVISGEAVDDVFTVKRVETEASIRMEVESLLDDYDLGVELVGLHLLDVHAPVEIHQVFRAVADAAERKKATILQATAEAVLIVSGAEVFVITETHAAQAVAQARVRSASGFFENLSKRAAVFHERPVETKKELLFQVTRQVFAGLKKKFVPVTRDRVRSGLWFAPKDVLPKSSREQPIPRGPAGAPESERPTDDPWERFDFRR